MHMEQGSSYEKGPDKSFRNAAIIILSLFLVIILCVVNDASENSSIFTGGLDQTSAEMYVRRFMKQDYLKDPDSYESISWSDLMKAGDGTYYITHSYRAKNSFGGYVIETKIFHLDSEGNIINIH